MAKSAYCKEVEAPHLVGTVVGAVARADAAVVDHLVEAVGAVDGGLDGTDLLARGRLAVHAGHRLEVGRGRRGRRRPRSSGRCAASASRGRASPAPCRRRGCCSRPGRRRRRPQQPMQALRSMAMPHPCGRIPAAASAATRVCRPNSLRSGADPPARRRLPAAGPACGPSSIRRFSIFSWYCARVSARTALHSSGSLLLSRPPAFIV